MFEGAGRGSGNRLSRAIEQLSTVAVARVLGMMVSNPSAVDATGDRDRTAFVSGIDNTVERLDGIPAGGPDLVTVAPGRWACSETGKMFFMHGDHCG